MSGLCSEYRVMTDPARLHPMRAVLALMSLLACASAVHAEAGGYFGGVRLDRVGTMWSFSSPGLKLGQGLEFGYPVEPAVESSTAFGGVQLSNGLSFGASLSTLRGLGQTVSSRPSLGLQLDPMQWAMATRSGQRVNLDLVSAFNWRSALSVYGRLGVGRGDLRPTDPLAPVATGVDRTQARYGLGLRYDYSPSLGLKLELTRGVKSPWERWRIEPEGDSIQFGLRWVF